MNRLFKGYMKFREEDFHSHRELFKGFYAQSAKEALYVPTTRDEKYKAKAFIDMFVQRFAKAIAVGVSLGITTVFTDFSSVRWLSIFTVVVIALWLVAARYAGHHFREVTEGKR